MKKLILCLMCMSITGLGYSQGIIKLDALKMEYNPNALQIDESTNSLSFKVSEDYIGQFHSNPIKYAKENFSIMSFIEANRNKNFDTYIVTFKTSKGNLKVNYNDKGEIISTSQMFKDVRLPYQSMLSLLKTNEGYLIAGTKHIAYSKSGDKITQEFYKAKLANGNKNKTVKININRNASGVAVATLE